MSTSVDVDVYAHDRSAASTFDHVGKAATKNSGLIKKFGVSLAGAFTGAAIFNGARDLTHLLIGQTEAAAQDQQGVAQLALQLHNSAGANKAADAAAEDWITTIGKQLGVTDDDLRPALERMVSATHDVSAAQDDVSLAMDISAGRHKSLQTVVEALAKAEQGNTAGLGRLGVATKDASGKALTLDQITQDLAKTYKGSAAAAADTAAGKYKILDTQFHELGESIGYWLLPKATDFGQWVLDDGVPAAQQLTHWLGDELGPTVRDIGGWFSDNQDELKDFGRTVGEDVVGGLRTVVEVGGKVVGFLDGLPGPVKKVGIEVGIAAYAFRELSGVLSPVTRGLASFAAGARTAETRSATLGAAARQAAGMAGMALLIDSTQRSNNALSTLEGTAGAAAVGFSVAGPWGAAIGGAGGLVYELGSKFGGARLAAEKAYRQIEATDPLKKAEAANDELRASLDQVSGAYTATTRAAVLQHLQDSHLVDTANQLGISTRTLVSAAMGQRGAMVQVTAVAGTYQTQIASVDDQLKALKDDTASYVSVSSGGHAVGRVLTEDALKHATALETQKKALEQNLAEFQTMPGALAADAKAIRENTAATADYTGKLKGIPDDVKTQIAAEGIEPTTQAIADLTTKYNLTPKQIKTLISATGTDTSAAQVQHVIDKMNQLHDKRVTVTVDTIHTPGGRDVPLPGGGGKSAAGASQRTLGDIVGDRLRGSSSSSWGGLGPNQLSHAGADLLASLVNGLEKGRKPLNRVLDAIKKDVANKLSARAQLQQLHDQLAGGFSGFKDSIFGVQATDEGPVTVEQLLAKAASEKAKAGQVDQDVQALLNAGVSEDMIKELQAQGASGIDALHALAGANADQLKQIVADNAAAQSSYLHAGQLAGDKFYSQAIEQANAQLAIALGVEKTVQKIDDLVGRLDKVEFILHGSDLVASLVKDKKEKGKQ